MITVKAKKAKCNHFFRRKTMKVKGFTLIELMVVILIVGILAAASVPMMRGRIDSAKWSEANATAGTIKSAVRVFVAENGAAAAPTGLLSVAATQTALGPILYPATTISHRSLTRMVRQPLSLPAVSPMLRVAARH
jgi:prepilin-type N-terminal cleavage/methylation domain-containing protein